jgi:2-dehydropantoate 2-reductase
MTFHKGGKSMDKRIVVVGAGAIGGYFGARLAVARRDVTFLVRPKRAEQLEGGLIVRSPKGDAKVAAPKLVAGASSVELFDLVLLSCKSYDLDGAMTSFAPAVGPATMILPLLNGESHIDTLKKRFGAGAVLGGQCQISSTLDEQGHIVHLNDWHLLGFGELDGSRSTRIEAVNETFLGANFEPQLSLQILQDMWEKWVFIASMAGITCLMRAALGDIATAGGTNLALELFSECSAISGKNGYVLRAAMRDRIRKTLSTPDSTLMASMLRDVEGRRRTEHEHILGELLARAQGIRAPVLETCLVHLRAYEARRTREN